MLRNRIHIYLISVWKKRILWNECAFIGDSLKKDVEGSTKCGLRGTWYTQEKSRKMEAKFPVIKSFEKCEY